MRTAVALLAIICLSCGLSDTIRQHQRSPTDSLKTDAKTLMNNEGGHVSFGNREIWQKVVERPDSASLFIEIDENIQALVTISGKLDSTYYSPNHITISIANKPVQKIQVVGNVNMWVKDQPHPFVKFEDVNFDGSRDIQVFDNGGAINFWYCTWLFTSKKGFVFSEDYSNIPSPKMLPDVKQIMSYYHFGMCEESIGFFSVEKNKLHAVKYYVTSPENCLTTKKELIDGKWKETSLGEWEISIYDSLYYE